MPKEKRESVETETSCYRFPVAIGLLVLVGGLFLSLQLSGVQADRNLVEQQATSHLVSSLHSLAPRTVFGIGAFLSLLAGTLALGLCVVQRRRVDMQLTRTARTAQIRFDLEAAPTGMIMTDTEGKIVMVNRQLERLFGYDQGALVGQCIDVLVPMRFRPDHLRMRESFLNRPQSRIMGAGREVYGLHSDGSEVPIEIRLNPLQIAGSQFVLSSIADITERKRAAESEAKRSAELVEANAILEQKNREVEANEKRFRLMVDSVKDYAIFMLDAVGNVAGWNAGAQRIKGYQEREIVGRHFSAFYTEDDIAAGKPARALEKAAANGRVEDEDWRVRKDGTRFIANVVITALRDNSGQLIGFVKVTRDVTERRQAEAALRESEQRLRMITDNIPGLISHLDKELRFRFVNQTYATWFNVDPAALIGTRLKDFHGENLSARDEAALQSALLGNPVTAEREVVGNGVTRHCQVVLIPERDHAGEVVGLFSIHTDITHRRRAEMTLRASESFLARTGAVAGVGGWEMDLVAGTITWSPEIQRMLAVPPDYVPTLEGTLQFYTSESRRSIEKSIRDGIDRAQPYDLELELTSATGRRFWVRAIGAAEFEEGRAVRLVGAIQDITERREAAQKLQEAVADADRANKAKSEFLANMSHEIRTPLNAVIGLGYLLDQTPLNADQRHFVAKIEFAGRSLLSVVNNVLDLSKIEAGEMLLDEEQFDLPEVLTDIGQMLLPQVAAKGIELVTEVAPALPRWVRGDVTRLRQILTNLVNNAIKFTEEGCVTVAAWSIAEDAGRIRLRCEIRDTGIGIEPSAMERLFTPFTQADASTTRRFGGTGLGLSIARRFVDLMGGDIGVTSTVAVGSTFWFEIPLERAVDVNARSSEESLPGLRILVADAAGDAKEGLGTKVRALGWNPEVISSREKLLLSLALHRTGRCIDVLILDLGLRDPDPVETISRVKAELAGSDMPPTIVVADAALSSLPYYSFMRPEDLFLVRPVTNSSLFNAINAAVWRQSGGRERLLQSTNLEELLAQWLVGVRVLVVDDSDINLEVARRILEEQGAVVSTCSDGKAAVDYIREHGVDVVLMDVQMPVLDGNQAVQEIRADLKLDKLPIIALTAGAMLGERQRSLASGMNDVISKPFDPLTLIRKVRHLVERARGEPIKMVLVDRPTVAADKGVLMASIDVGVAQQIFGEDLPLFKTVLARLLREYADLALPTGASLVDPMARADLMARVHKLKGSAGTVGATRVMHLAGEAENTLRHNRPTEEVVRVLRQLVAALAVLRDEAAPLLIEQPQEVRHASSGTEGSSNIRFVLEDLCALLESRDLAAVDRAAEHAPLLTTLLGAGFERVRDAIDNLDFVRAADLLRGLRLESAQAVAAIDDPP
jgi:PAS domain S-box-containing protein